MDNPQISWAVLADRHQKGETKLGPVWLRTDRSGSVTGVYTLFGRTKKLVPGPDETWTVEDAHVVAELELEAELHVRALIAEVLS
jgi:hypothetical protein